MQFSLILLHNTIIFCFYSVWFSAIVKNLNIDSVSWILQIIVVQECYPKRLHFLIYTILGTIYFLPSGKSHPKIMFDNYEYVIRKKLPDSTRWRCGNCNKTKCRSYAVTLGRFLYLFKPHNHPPTFNSDTSSVPSSTITVVKNKDYGYVY